MPATLMSNILAPVNPENGEVKRFELPGAGTKDSHTMDFTRDGDIYFTVQNGNQLGFRHRK